MNNRLVIYFHYDPRGQADTACRFAVQAMRKPARVLLFVHNGTLDTDSRAWLERQNIPVLERENEGLDVGAYRQALLHIGQEELRTFDEVVLMNYTLAGPVRPLEEMFARMDSRQELDFWGLSRHYAMRSRRFGKNGFVPEHIQSHFIAVRPRMYEDFWAYWQKMELPRSYEDSVRLHETRFTEYFSALGYRWDTVVDGDAWRDLFVNPIMGCPRELIERESCPFFKRRSFFTPYADELRRTDGCAAARLYELLKKEEVFPVDDLIRSLLPTQPLAQMSRNLHWHYLLPQETGEKPVSLTAQQLENGAVLSPEKIYSVQTPLRSKGVLRWYEQQMIWPDDGAAATLFARYPVLGVLGPAMPLYLPAVQAEGKCWKKDLPHLQARMRELGLKIPLDPEMPLPGSSGGCLLLRGAAFPQGLPPIHCDADFRLLPLIAQQNGYYSADVRTWLQAAACADVHEAALQPTLTLSGAGKLLARRIKHTLLSRKEGDE